MKLRYFTMRFGGEYVKVVASDIFVAIKWAVEHNEGLKAEDIDYVSGEDVAIAE
jgi:hypothetical protein